MLGKKLQKKNAAPRITNIRTSSSKTQRRKKNKFSHFDAAATAIVSEQRIWEMCATREKLHIREKKTHERMGNEERSNMF